MQGRAARDGWFFELKAHRESSRERERERERESGRERERESQLPDAGPGKAGQSATGGNGLTHSVNNLH